LRFAYSDEVNDFGYDVGLYWTAECPTVHETDYKLRLQLH